MPKNNPQVDPNTGELPFDDDFQVPVIDLNQKVSKLVEVYEELAPSGQGCKAEELVGQTLTVRYMKKFIGRFTDTVTGQPSAALWCILTTKDGTLMNTVFGGKVMCEKLWTARTRLPLEFTLVKMNQGSPSEYYDAE